MYTQMHIQANVLPHECKRRLKAWRERENGKKANFSQKRLVHLGHTQSFVNR